MGAELEFFHNFHDDLGEEIGGTIFVDAIQCPKENVIVEMFRSNCSVARLLKNLENIYSRRSLNPTAFRSIALIMAECGRI
jgi:hypothetical protein